MNDLNAEVIITADGPFQKLIDPSTRSADGSVIVHFRNLENSLIQYIDAATVIVGCVAWLTSFPILDALAKVRGGVSLVVQKEDFLRPDLGPRDNWKTILRRKYTALPQGPARWAYGDGVFTELNTSDGQIVDAVRCVGNYNRAKAPAFPRAHHKFVVFCRLEYQSHGIIDGFEHGYDLVVPYAVWTGSFNFTRNAGMSLENALYITDSAIVGAYFYEWQQIAALSEPLDWESDWVQPEWRIGT